MKQILGLDKQNILNAQRFVVRGNKLADRRDIAKSIAIAKFLETKGTIHDRQFRFSTNHSMQPAIDTLVDKITKSVYQIKKPTGLYSGHLFFIAYMNDISNASKYLYHILNADNTSILFVMK